MKSKVFNTLLGICWLSPSVAACAAEETLHCRVTGLFAPDRVADLREACLQLPGITLASVDDDTAAAVFRFDPATVMPGAKPEQYLERMNNLLRQQTRSTFGLLPPSTLPREKLTFVEIPVVGLDCKGCCLAAYEAVYRLDGVEQAAASFKAGRVTAWIDATKTSQAALEAALEKKRVALKPKEGNDAGR
jgi:hypothetical protein